MLSEIAAKAAEFATRPDTPASMALLILMTALDPMLTDAYGAAFSNIGASRRPLGLIVGLRARGGKNRPVRLAARVNFARDLWRSVGRPSGDRGAAADDLG